MSKPQTHFTFVSSIRRFLLLSTLVLSFECLLAQSSDKKPIDIEFTGMFWLTTTYNFKSSDPNWAEMLRPSKLLDGQGRPFADNGQFSLGVRPSRFGFNTKQETPWGPLSTRFEFDLVGGGSNVGETFFRVFNAYAEWNRFSFGKKNSVFMDGTIGPATVDFFGPSGMVWLRNVQISYQIIQKEKQEWKVGLENPSATSDLGPFRQSFAYAEKLNNISFTNKLPALTSHYRRNFLKGHVQLGGVVKYISWFDRSATALENYSGRTWGYGANLTGSFRPTKNWKWVGALVFGKGIQNFLNDGSADVGVQRNLNNTVTPVRGAAIPFTSFMVGTEWNWNNKYRSTIAYSGVHNQTFSSQLNTAQKSGSYFTAAIFRNLFDQVHIGLEYQYASRKNTDFSGDPSFALPPANGAFFAVQKIQANLVYRFASKRREERNQ